MLLHPQHGGEQGAGLRILRGYARSGAARPAARAAHIAPRTARPGFRGRRKRIFRRFVHHPIPRGVEFSNTWQRGPQSGRIDGGGSAAPPRGACRAVGSTRDFFIRRRRRGFPVCNANLQIQTFVCFFFIVSQMCLKRPVKNVFRLTRGACCY
jgi:hypothetical protein